MTDPVPERIRSALADVIRRVVAGDFDGLISDGFAPRHEGADLGLWVRDYPARLVDFPNDGWQYAEAVTDPDRPGWWAVNVPLWTYEEGRSDLELEANVTERGRHIRVEIDNIHVP